MLFADDIGIMADCKNSLIKAIKAIEDWSTNNQLQLNKKKSHIVYIKGKPKSKLEEYGLPS